MNRLVGEMLELARGLGREAHARWTCRRCSSNSPGRRAKPAGRGGGAGSRACLGRADGPATVARQPVVERAALRRRPAVELGAPRADGVRIGVLDRGPGIPPDQIEAVFRRSTAWKPSRSPGTGGSGLGLAIVRQLAQANGWTVELENRDGGGLAAWVTLPDTGRSALSIAKGSGVNLSPAWTFFLVNVQPEK